ncbi:liprin-alpha-1 [Hydra vulgaris]|uniref:liprin-alpha-1 n=1 Tax=Hydra vulgaris TaxID=6087 RepID=UPI001F5E93C4|nr:liprin-alpha-1 [Hydra vulgaris]
MICDIMPTLSEDGDMIGDGSLEDNNFEQLMVNMLDERDKLMETLRDTQDALANMRNSLKEVEFERDTLLQEFDIVLSKCNIDRDELIQKISSFDNEDDLIISRLHQQKNGLAEEFVNIAKDLFHNKEKLNERNEEIAELKAERNNTKLLLEHLESLVSRHERSLRMTVVKRQAQSSAGVSSEVEVLKALKSLFEHHKALDEKIREKLRMAVEKANSLEEDLVAANQEIDRLQSEKEQLRAFVKKSETNNFADGMTNDNINEIYMEMNDLKYRLEQKKRELDKSVKENKEMQEKFSQLEDQVTTTNRKASFSQENNQKIIKELEEAVVQKNDIENRMMVLEKRYVRSQNELSSAGEELERLRAELFGLQTMLEQKDEKIENLQEQCKFYEMKFSQTVKHVEELPKIQEELENRKAALNAAEERNFTAEEKVQNLQAQLDEITEHLARANECERLTVEHNIKLQSTIDKLMAESNYQLQKQLKERMQSIDDKNNICQQLEKSKSEIEKISKEKNILVGEISKLKEEILSLKRESFLTGSKVVTSPTTGLPVAHSRVPAILSPVFRTSSLSAGSKLSSYIPPKDETDNTWQKMNQANVISNVAIALNNKDDLKSLSRIPAIIDDTLESLTSSDAHRLASMLQNQLNAINEELELLQVEHRNTELLTEQIEKRVGSETSSLDGSINSKDSSENKIEDRKLKLNITSDTYSKPDRRNPSDTNDSFGFTRYDPLDTKPLMLKQGRSQEMIADQLSDAPNSLGSDCSDKLKSNSTTHWSSNSFEPDREFDFSSSSSPGSMTNSLESLTRRGGKNKSLRTSIGKIFSTKGKLKPRDLELGQSEDLDSNAEAQRDAETRMKHKLLEDIMASGAPFASWNAPAILAWLELWVKLPEWYIHACRANVKSGSIMSALSDYEIQHEIGVNNPLHRLKLRLAVHEMVNVTLPVSPPTKTSLVYGDMNHFWIASEWLASLGLPQYRYSFIENLVDARMLGHISKKEQTKYLKVIDGFHRNSLDCGTKCLEILNYDRKMLEKRRSDALNEKNDILVWTNARVIKWVSSIGLDEFSQNLCQSGVHGAVIALDEHFDVDMFAYYLQIPSTNEKARKILAKEYSKLIDLCNDLQKYSQSDLVEGDFRRTKSWRKKFKKDKSVKDKSRKVEDNSIKRYSGDAETSYHFPRNAEVTSPTRRLTKSPIIDRRNYSVHSRIT